jgi:21S rRNA (GM2251-2'-O)-methyltransferase
MVFSSLLGSTLLRTQRSQIPLTFRRYKSLTAVIERGKQGGPDRPFRPRARAPPEEDGGERVKNREERRFDQYGPSSKSRDYSKKPWAGSSQDRDEKPRSSRFGRVGTPRSLEDAPSRFVKDGEEGPSGSDDGFRPRRRPHFDTKPGDRWEGRGSKGTTSRSSYGARSERPDRNRYSEGGNRRLPPREFSGRGEQEGRFDRRPRDESSSYTREGRGPAHGFDDRPPRRDRPSYGSDDRPPRQDREGYGQRDRQPPRSGFGERRSDQAGTAPAPTGGAQLAPVRDLESLPYSTAASEFIYGYSSVLAAMKANRRKLYKLYVHSRGASRDGLMAKIRALKMFKITEEVGDEYLRAMDRASSGRPHNGVILETSPLPVPPITELRQASKEDESFSVKVGTQTTEDAFINGNREIYNYKSAGWRHPLILYVDGVVSLPPHL